MTINYFEGCESFRGSLFKNKKNLKINESYIKSQYRKPSKPIGTRAWLLYGTVLHLYIGSETLHSLTIHNFDYFVKVSIKIK